MAQRRKPESRPDNQEAGDDTEANLDSAPMKRFRSLARRLVKVSREELENERLRYAAEKPRRNKQKRSA
jgi:hypothetical protein